MITIENDGFRRIDVFSNINVDLNKNEIILTLTKKILYNKNGNWVEEVEARKPKYMQVVINNETKIDYTTGKKILNIFNVDIASDNEPNNENVTTYLNTTSQIVFKKNNLTAEWENYHLIPGTFIKTEDGNWYRVTNSGITQAIVIGEMDYFVAKKVSDFAGDENSYIYALIKTQVEQYLIENGHIVVVE